MPNSRISRNTTKHFVFFWPLPTPLRLYRLQATGLTRDKIFLSSVSQPLENLVHLCGIQFSGFSSWMPALIPRTRLLPGDTDSPGVDGSPGNANGGEMSQMKIRTY